VPGLFARNERVVCVFESKVAGRFVLALVGATIVGSMATIWHGTIDRPRTHRVRDWPYAADQVTLKRGEEMGRFMLGSTVVMLFAKGAGLAFNPLWEPGRAIRLGEAMASVTPPPPAPA
jgi:phosphatidylserine decarboxylase